MRSEEEQKQHHKVAALGIPCLSFLWTTIDGYVPLRLVINSLICWPIIIYRKPVELSGWKVTKSVMLHG
jgi:hypothetical protein